MRRSLLGLALAVVAYSVGSGQAHAQLTGTTNDPISLYYGLYLPRQQAQALQPGPEAAITALNASRQAYAATNRNDAFDSQLNRFDLDSSDFGFNTGSRGPGGPMQAARIGQNLNGQGPARYYGRNLKNYHPAIRTGIGRNNNIGTTRTGRGFSSGGYGGVGVPGPR